MRIISYDDNGSARLGVLTSDTTFTAVHEADPSFPGTLDDLLQTPDWLDRLRTAIAGAGGTHQLGEVKLQLPIRRPHAFWALALNFKAHIEETKLTTSDEFPQIFLRQPMSFVPPSSPLVCPPPDIARAFDYEGELGVVIGRPGRHIPVERALDHVAGYVVVNEGSVREFQRHN